ncbi:glycosyltransferase family 2 protein [Ascidiaceihabitans sp.]|uniref:glycosyltransferase family 2 protein n=1 Tax=Ascidiaceihabitans sp. TaxID=1872644 RepID=UPI0032983F19
MLSGAPTSGLLSIVVTFFDETPFLRTALRSIRNQGIAQLELIVVNDNPENFTPEDLSDLTDGFDARVIHHIENKGLSAARNTGIDAANGDLIGFLDADDYYTVGGLNRHATYARETEADITHAGCYMGRTGSAHGVPLMRDEKLHMRQRVVSGRMAADEAQFIVSSWSSLYRADFLARNDLWFDVAQRKFEDRLFVLNTITQAQKVAFLGAPVRVWRQRANSISSTVTTPDTHLLQVQLLEKCLSHIKAETKAHALPQRYEKRELFNCVSRLIWDMDILPRLAAKDPAYDDMGQRIQTLLGDASFGHQIFSDPMVAATSRVGMRTKKGKITRADFFELHKLWREGQFTQAHDIMQARAPIAQVPKAVSHKAKRLVLHIGLHKTGTTFVQHHLYHHRTALLRKGVLVPQTGFDGDKGIDGRPGAMSGHQGLLRALRSDDDAVWTALHQEIALSPARTVLISAENMGFPTQANREEMIAALMARLGGYASVDVIAFVRRPDTYVEAFYREWVTSAHPSGARSIDEVLVDHTGHLTDLDAMFRPFENITGQPVLLADFDALRAEDALWSGFCALGGLPTDLGRVAAPRYASAHREDVALMQMINMVQPSAKKRARLMGAFFATPNDSSTRDQSLLPPARRQALLARYAESSAEFATARGYNPDLDAAHAALKAEDWTALDHIPLSRLQATLDVGAQVMGETDTPQAHAIARPKPPTATGRYEVKIKLRPWAVKLIERVRRR